MITRPSMFSITPSRCQRNDLLFPSSFSKNRQNLQPALNPPRSIVSSLPFDPQPTEPIRQDPLSSIAVPESLYIRHHRPPVAFGKSISVFYFFFVHILRTDSRSPRLLNGDLLPAFQLWGFSLNHEFPPMHRLHNRGAPIFTAGRGFPSWAYICSL